MKNIYIIISYNIHGMGGGQSFVASRASYLEKNGWRVYVFSAGNKDGDFYFKQLAKYVDGCIHELAWPPFFFFRNKRERVMREMLNIISATVDDNIIIETHTDITDYWGEILAERIRGKHIIIPCYEYFVGKNKYYDLNQDYYEFKNRRGEIFTSSSRLERIFQGKKTKNPMPIWDIESPIVEQAMVQDVENELLNKIVRADYNIGLISRMNKEYVPYMIEGVVNFSKKYSEKKIALILIGDEAPISGFLEENVCTKKNIMLYRLGVMIPVPRKFFELIDVVMAGAGAARQSADENIPVIVSDSDDCKFSPGVLGYDTIDTLYGHGGEKRSFEKVLNDVLVDGKYVNKEISLPKRDSTDCRNKTVVDMICEHKSTRVYKIDKFVKTKYSEALLISLRSMIMKSSIISAVLRRLKAKIVGCV